MQRDQRAEDNWALIYAQEMAIERKQPLIVIFCLVESFLGAAERHYRFMLKGLSYIKKDLEKYSIPFYFLQGEPSTVIPAFIAETGASALVTDFNPLRMTMQWRTKVNAKLIIPFFEVDAHNIVPCRFVSDKQEFGARTLRTKISRLLPDFLVPFPELVRHPFDSQLIENITAHTPLLLKEKGPGDEATNEKGQGDEADGEAFKKLDLFLNNKLEKYHLTRNFPELDGQSNLSPYLHFGQLSAQRIALEVQSAHAPAEAKSAFLEELIVRRELSDNYCLYNPDYDRFEGFPAWARTTLNLHRNDPRSHLYDISAFENGETHDDLWNAAQKEMVITGKLHGYMRMYWAKKILEWTASPEEAQAIAIYLNDKYSLDGRDPNGYAGIAWSVGGVHDRPWQQRPVFGMIRYMNYKGCERKFNVKEYIRKINAL
jgi:deoxyribodipyrimidine photo-lyase